ncbi:unnamed protein product [Cunninghamella blakesleeana]
MIARATLRIRSNVATIAKRYSSTSESAGATASTKDFGSKEKAIENQWARVHDAEKLKILRKELDAQKKATEDLSKKIEELETKK